tara:strand:- start:180 stop:1040 length:861 start_codon:yes stop_codon:yes gene_type:complete
MAGGGKKDSTRDSHIDLTDAGSSRFSIATIYDTPDNTHTVANMPSGDFHLRIAMGLVRGMSVGTVFGRNIVLPITTEETVWDYGGIYTYLSADTELFLSSSSASDTNVGLVVTGLTDDYVQKTLVVTHTSGQSQQSIGNWYRVFRAVVVSGTAPVGDIYVAETDTLTAGVPNTAAKVKDKVTFDSNVSHAALYTVPANHTLYVTRVFIGVRKNEDVVITFTTKGDTQPAFIKSTDFAIYQSTAFHTFEPQFTVPEKTDIEFRAVSAANNTQVTVNMAYILVDNTLV